MGDLPGTSPVARVAGHADVNAPTKEGATPLHYAASKGHADIVRELFETGPGQLPGGSARRSIT